MARGYLLVWATVRQAEHAVLQISAVVLGACGEEETVTVAAYGRIEDRDVRHRLSVLDAAVTQELLRELAELCGANDGEQPQSERTAARTAVDKPAEELPRQTTDEDADAVLQVRVLRRPAVAIIRAGGAPRSGSAAPMDCRSWCTLRTTRAAPPANRSWLRFGRRSGPGTPAAACTRSSPNCARSLPTALVQKCSPATTTATRLDADRVRVDLWGLEAAVTRASSALQPEEHRAALWAVVESYDGELADGHSWLWLMPVKGEAAPCRPSWTPTSRWQTWRWSQPPPWRCWSRPPLLTRTTRTSISG
jgi:hypothetical protein